MPERWFLALWPDASTVEALVSLQSARGRRIDPADLHLTLAFLGALRAEQLVCVEQVACGIRAARIHLLLDCIGYFSRSRVSWCGASEVPAALSILVSRLREGLADSGFALDSRPFQPHVTLARKVESGHRCRLVEPVAWTSSQFVLAVGHDGCCPRYEVCRRWLLDSHD